MTEIKKRSEKYQTEEPKKMEQQEVENIEKEGPSLLKKIIIYFIILCILFIIYIVNISTKLVITKEYKIESSLFTETMNGLKIVQFSDIHYGNTINTKELNSIIDKINDLKPDIIFFTGDLIDANINISEESKQEIIDALNKLSPTLYTYAIYGNEDKDTYQEIINNTNIKLLNNESTLLYYKDTTPIEIIGFNTMENNPDYSIISNNVEELDTNNLYKIILVHEPDSFQEIKNYNIGLVLAGDSLGNLINIPVLRNLFTKEHATLYNEEHYEENNIQFFISSGLGTNDFKIRFNNRPSISLYRLYKE